MGCGYLRFGSRVSDPLSWVLALDYARKKCEGGKSLCFTIPKLSISSSYIFLKCRSLYILCFDTLTNSLIFILVFLHDMSEGMFLLHLSKLAETAYLKVYGNYPEELFHMRKFSCSKDFRNSTVDVLLIYVYMYDA